jgi:DnaJ homolog subfamily C member 27
MQHKITNHLCAFRFCEEQFVSKYIPTIGVDYGVKPLALAGHDVRVNFFDLAGQPEYEVIRQEFYKDAQGALLVYNPAERESFVALQRWLREAEANGATDMVCPP